MATNTQTIQDNPYTRPAILTALDDHWSQVEAEIRARLGQDRGPAAEPSQTDLELLTWIAARRGGGE